VTLASRDVSERLTPSDVLAIWEAGRDADALVRATAMWSVATGSSERDIDTVSIGARDRALLLSRIATFGPTAPSYVECPRCAAELEFALDLTALLSEEAEEGLGPHPFDHDGWHVEFCLPVTGDLRAAVAAGGRREALLARCIRSAARYGSSQPVSAAAVALVDALDAQMQRLDPQADIELKLDCAACRHNWVARFDIAHFLWREMEVEAARLLGEVHQLARAYGWSEPAVLALSPARRRAYLAMISGGAR
jgi:hypothetical protein